MTVEEIEESQNAGEVKRLKRELADARMENEFLKKRPPFSRRKPARVVPVDRSGKGELPDSEDVCMG